MLSLKLLIFLIILSDFNVILLMSSNKIVTADVFFF